MTDRKQPIIEISDLSFEFNGKALISIEKLIVYEPKITVILGPNGAGKSLLLKLIQGIQKPSAGRIKLRGIPIEENQERLTMVLQAPILLRSSVYYNIAMCMNRSNFFLSSSEKEAIYRLLKKVGLEDKLNVPAKFLSGGEKQKLSLARALISNPSILLVDEPTSTIDPTTTLLIENMIREQSELGTKIIFVTHDMNQAFRLANDAVMINKGKIVEHGSVENFFQKPSSSFTKRYLSGSLLC